LIWHLVIWDLYRYFPGAKFERNEGTNYLDERNLTNGQENAGLDYMIAGVGRLSFACLSSGYFLEMVI